jgi:hypothetical protein
MPRERNASDETIQRVAETYLELGVRPTVRRVMKRTGASSETVRRVLARIDASGQWINENSTHPGGHPSNLRSSSAPPGTSDPHQASNGLQQLHDELAIAQKEIEQLRTRVDELFAKITPKPPPPPIPAGHPLYGLTIPAASLKLLREVGHPTSTIDLAKDLQRQGFPFIKEPASAVHVALSRIEKKNGEVFRIARGKWALKSWFSEDEIDEIVKLRDGQPYRDADLHSENVQRASKSSRARGVRWGRTPFEELFPFDKITTLRTLLNNGMRADLAIAKIGMPLGTFKKYRKIIKDETNFCDEKSFYDAANKLREGIAAAKTGLG